MIHEYNIIYIKVVLFFFLFSVFTASERIQHLNGCIHSLIEKERDFRDSEKGKQLSAFELGPASLATPKLGAMHFQEIYYLKNTLVFPLPILRI